MALLSKKCKECYFNRTTLIHCQKRQNNAFDSVGTRFILLNILLLVIGLIYLFGFMNSNY